MITTIVRPTFFLQPLVPPSTRTIQPFVAIRPVIRLTDGHAVMGLGFDHRRRGGDWEESLHRGYFPANVGAGRWRRVIRGACKAGFPL